jgi:hypothetical protein
MLRHPRDREDDRDHTGTLEVFDIHVVDEPPPTSSVAAPRACRWHLWHHWALMRVDARTTYVGCAACGRLRTPTIFELPVP